MKNPPPNTQTTFHPRDDAADNTPRGTQAARNVLRRTVSGRPAWRSTADDVATPPPVSPPQPQRRVWSPMRADQGKSLLELNKMKWLMQNQLGHGARINENLTMNVPVEVLPYELKKASQ